MIAFLDLIQAAEWKVAIEVGAAGCGTSVLLSKAMGKGSTVISIDLPENMGGTPSENERIAGESVGPEASFHLVRGRSTSDSVLKAVSSLLDGKPADLVLIDAEHTEAAALGDYESYKGFISGRGAVAFHDICMPELWPMWNRLRGKVPPNRSMEIIEDLSQKDSGLGILLGRH